MFLLFYCNWCRTCTSTSASYFCCFCCCWCQNPDVVTMKKPRLNLPVLCNPVYTPVCVCLEWHYSSIPLIICTPIFTLSHSFLLPSVTFTSFILITFMPPWCIFDTVFSSSQSLLLPLSHSLFHSVHHIHSSLIYLLYMIRFITFTPSIFIYII